MRCPLLLFTLWFSLALCPQGAQAGYIHFCTLEELTQKADVLVVAEVVKVATSGGQPDHYPPLLRRLATLHVLRSLALKDTPKFTVGQTVELEFEVKDWDHLSAYTGVFDYPDFDVGNIELFPLKSPEPGTLFWHLVSYEMGCTLPATATALTDVQPLDGYKFIATELAGALANGTPRQRGDTARYLGYATHGRDDGGNAAPLSAINNLLVAYVHNEAQWLDIFLPLYAPRGGWVTPHPRIATLLSPPRRQDLRWFLPAQALRHVRPAGLDERIIAALLDSGEAGAYSSAQALQLNYPNDERVLRRLQDALAQDVPGALGIARELLSKNALAAKPGAPQPYPSLLPVALAAARRSLAQHEARREVLNPVCALVEEFGSKHDMALLAAEVERAQREDRVRYHELVMSCLFRQANTLPIWRVVISDAALTGLKGWGDDFRYCDLAVWKIQDIAHMDFGLKAPGSKLGLAGRDQPLAERDRAVAQAKTWLTEHPA